jgi:teichoic acid transport system permease protein
MTSTDRPSMPEGLFDISAPLSAREYLIRLWRNRDFVLNVPVGKLRAQTFNTTLGSLWHLINPLLNALLYYLVFGILFNANRTVSNYAVFLIVGVFTFMFTSRCVQSGSMSITNNLGIITQIRFPRAALPLSSTLAEALSHTIALAAMVVMSVVLGERPTMLWLVLPFVVVLQAVFNLGLALVVARLAFQFRDVQELLPHLLRAWMYFSGLFFPLSLVENAAGEGSLIVTLFRLNPAFSFMQISRGIIITEESFELFDAGVAVTWTVALVVFGFMYFRAREYEYSHG